MNSCSYANLIGCENKAIRQELYVQPNSLIHVSSGSQSFMLSCCWLQHSLITAVVGSNKKYVVSPNSICIYSTWSPCSFTILFFCNNSMLLLLREYIIIIWLALMNISVLKIIISNVALYNHWLWFMGSNLKIHSVPCIALHIGTVNHHLFHSRNYNKNKLWLFKLVPLLIKKQKVWDFQEVKQQHQIN